MMPMSRRQDQDCGDDQQDLAGPRFAEDGVHRDGDADRSDDAPDLVPLGPVTFEAGLVGLQRRQVPEDGGLAGRVFHPVEFPSRRSNFSSACFSKGSGAFSGSMGLRLVIRNFAPSFNSLIREISLIMMAWLRMVKVLPLPPPRQD